jgi:hypothetical protein
MVQAAAQLVGVLGAIYTVAMTPIGHRGLPRPYRAPRLTYLGNLVDVVQSGGGKASAQSPDGPDLRKPPGK